MSAWANTWGRSWLGAWGNVGSAPIPVTPPLAIELLSGSRGIELASGERGAEMFSGELFIELDIATVFGLTFLGDQLLFNGDRMVITKQEIR